MLRVDSGQRVICVSTNLIEAGVDISFGSAIRLLAGLDSIAQTAGRVNRHGERACKGLVTVVELMDEDLKHLCYRSPYLELNTPLTSPYLELDMKKKRNI